MFSPGSDLYFSSSILVVLASVYIIDSLALSPLLHHIIRSLSSDSNDLLPSFIYFDRLPLPEVYSSFILIAHIISKELVELHIN